VAELCVQCQLLGLYARGLLAQGVQLVEDLLSLVGAAAAGAADVQGLVSSSSSSIAR
jgi:hypothetical protein